MLWNQAKDLKKQLKNERLKQATLQMQLIEHFVCVRNKRNKILNKYFLIFYKQKLKQLQFLFQFI